MVIYLYSTYSRINTIILLNHIGLLVFHKIFSRNLKNIKELFTVFIKEQVSNDKLKSTLDNFEY